MRTMANDMNGGFGLYAFVHDLAADDFPFVAPPVFLEVPEPIRRLAIPISNAAPAAVVRHFQSRMVEFGSVSQLFGAKALAPVGAMQLPFTDSVGLFVQDGQRTGIQIVSLMHEVSRVHGRSRAAWRKIGLHIGAAWRLRRRLEGGREPEAVMSEGKVVDARGPAKSSDARAALVDAVRRIDHARSASERGSPERVLELWQGLVSGRWSLVDKWESDGRRYVAAYENGTSLGERRGFAPGELDALRMHLLRATDKEIAFALGLEVSTIGRVLANAARRIGLRSRADLARLSMPERIARLAVDLGDDRLDVLRFDEPGLPPAWRARLTTAQREVATAAARGLSDDQIARERGTSTRTVSNHLSATYRILALRGRADLVRGVGQSV
jgi:DNA-binding NarL/FixJ family response regulator